MTEETPIKPRLTQPKIIDVLIFSFVAILLVSIMALTFFEVVNGQRDYERALDVEFGQVEAEGLVTSGQAASPINRTYIIALLRASDFAFMRSATLMLAFTLIFLGALILFKSLQNSYELSASKEGGFEFSFRTASSGLVLSTLGFLLVIASLFASSNVNFQEVPVRGNLPFASNDNQVSQTGSFPTQPGLEFGGSRVDATGHQTLAPEFDEASEGSLGGN